jgi:hypothetical protein
LENVLKQEWKEPRFNIVIKRTLYRVCLNNFINGVWWDSIIWETQKNYKINVWYWIRENKV